MQFLADLDDLGDPAQRESSIRSIQEFVRTLDAQGDAQPQER